MNENIDLTKILKDCPKGFKLYSPMLGDVEFIGMQNKNETFPIRVKCIKPENSKFNVLIFEFTKEGYYFKCKGECLLFPSKDQRDWSKFTAPWYKKERFDPKTLAPFEKVLVRDNRSYCWRCAFFSHIRGNEEITNNIYATTANSYAYCIPFNDDTKHLVGTNEEAPEYYRYLED